MMHGADGPEAVREHEEEHKDIYESLLAKCFPTLKMATSTVKEDEAEKRPKKEASPCEIELN